MSYTATKLHIKERGTDLEGLGSVQDSKADWDTETRDRQQSLQS
jgi:hypothetical protein